MISVEGLSVRYGDVAAVRDLTFRADAGEVTCVLGRNGAGKTSTIEALEGLRRPAAGHLSVLGLDPQRDHGCLVERMGVMLQDVGIHPAVRVKEALHHAAALYPDPLSPGDLIIQVGLDGLERRTFRQLSGGEQRRLALALALIGRPDVVFLDEPTSGVDAAGRQVIRQIVADLRDAGATVLLSTHELDEAERMADRVVIVDRGELRAEGPLPELMATAGQGEVRFLAEPGLDAAALSNHLDGAAVQEPAPGEYLVGATGTPQLIAALTAWLAAQNLFVSDLRTGRSLEDLFLELTGQ